MIKLAEECNTRVQRLLKGFVKKKPIFNDVRIKLRFVGKVTEDDLKHVTQRKGNTLYIVIEVCNVHNIPFAFMLNHNW